MTSLALIITDACTCSTGECVGCRRRSEASCLAAAEKFGRPTNDASRTLLHGSNRETQKTAISQVRGLLTTSAIIIAALAILASPSLADEPHAGLLDGTFVDRIEKRADQLRESLDRNAAQSREWGERFDRFDGIRDRQDKIVGSRIGNFLDRIERVFWLVVILAVAVAVAITAACAMYGIERVSAAGKAMLNGWQWLVALWRVKA